MFPVTLRDRFFTKPVAEAIMSPGGILAAGVGTAAGVLVGVPLAAAVFIGAGVWAARVGVAIPRGPVAERIDRRTVSGPWKAFVDEAVAAQERFDTAVTRTRPGPIRDRLSRVGERIEHFVTHSYRVAQSGQQLSEARAMIDTGRIAADLTRLEGADRVGPTTEQAAVALRAQLDTAHRLDTTIRSTYDRLMLLDARLDELVTRSIELSVTGGDPDSIGSVEREVQGVVDELESVRMAVEETG